MLIKKMLKNLISIYILLILSFSQTSVFGDNSEFDTWVKNFKTKAIESGVSKKVVDEVMSDAIFLPKVIGYDRFQPEFYEDTYTYIKKRTNKRKVRKGLALYKKEKSTIDKIEKEFLIEKELLLALMGIETNFGNYLGKMDIVSSLATLSFDKRRSKYFTEELLTLLKLVDKKILKKESLFGSWAGALGNFQFMPSSIKRHAIDYDNDGYIDLKKSKHDAIASAANYINKMGWKQNTPCFNKVNFKKKIDSKLFNHSAKKIFNKKKISSWKNLGVISTNTEIKKNDFYAGLILPDGNLESPKYLVYDNYEIILKWNRSLRFALSVCTLAESIKNEL